LRALLGILTSKTGTEITVEPEGKTIP